METLTAPPQLTSFGKPLEMDDASFGLLRDSSDAADDFVELRRRVAEDGYLYMKGYLDRDEVLAARASLVEPLADAGLLDPDSNPMDGIMHPDNVPGAKPKVAIDKAQSGHPHGHYGFRPDLANGNPVLEKLLYAGRLTEFYRQLYAEDIRHYDFTWLRMMTPGKGSNPHCDLPYMGRGTDQHMTCWLPYGDISFTLGGLMILEGSHKRMDLLENYVYRDVDSFCENKPEQVERAKNGGWTFTGTLSQNPPVIRRKFGGRWLTSEFAVGDFITFGMFLVHASLDNNTTDRLRISSDSRYQRASEPIDERWVGVNPPGHSQAGKRGRIC